jgi:hypothetical protein
VVRVSRYCWREESLDVEIVEVGEGGGGVSCNNLFIMNQ